MSAELDKELSGRDLQIAQLTAAGMTSREVAKAVGAASGNSIRQTLRKPHVRAAVDRLRAEQAEDMEPVLARLRSELVAGTISAVRALTAAVEDEEAAHGARTQAAQVLLSHVRWVDPSSPGTNDAATGARTAVILVSNPLSGDAGLSPIDKARDTGG